MARKTKYNPQLVAKILKHIKNGSNLNDSAQLSGISPATFYEYMNQYTEFSDKVQEAISKSKEKLIKSIIKHGKTNWQAHSWLLERRYPQEYALKIIQGNMDLKDDTIKLKIIEDKPKVLEGTIQEDNDTD